MRRFLLLLGVVAVFGVVTSGLVGVVSPAAASETHGAPTQLFGVTSYTSPNWAGYFASGANDSVTKVTGAWTVPSVTCPATGTYFTVFWVGIDGATDTTVEQIGTLATCTAGSAAYSAWWELYPKNAIQYVTSITVAPGDAVKASVTWSSSAMEFVMKITVAGHSFTKKGTQAGVLRQDAECIVERPATSSGLLKLADFGTVTFSSCIATINGAAGGIQKFGTSGAITMVDSSARTMATVTAATGSGRFTVTWVRAN